MDTLEWGWWWVWNRNQCRHNRTNHRRPDHFSWHYCLPDVRYRAIVNGIWEYCRIRKPFFRQWELLARDCRSKRVVAMSGLRVSFAMAISRVLSERSDITSCC
jgi:hypothetical protein